MSYISPDQDRDRTYECVNGVWVKKARCGILFRWGSAWVGVHYSAVHKRTCINVIPFVTFWITQRGGDVP